MNKSKEEQAIKQLQGFAKVSKCFLCKNKVKEPVIYDKKYLSCRECIINWNKFREEPSLAFRLQPVVEILTPINNSQCNNSTSYKRKSSLRYHNPETCYDADKEMSENETSDIEIINFRPKSTKSTLDCYFKKLHDACKKANNSTCLDSNKENHLPENLRSTLNLSPIKNCVTFSNSNCSKIASYNFKTNIPSKLQY